MNQYSEKDFEKSLVIFTDGAASGNPGPGGYGAVLINKIYDEVVELGGGKPNTTNNEMELSAVIAALGYASMNNAPTYIFTDSSYVINGITKWVFGWEKNGWKTTTKQDVANKALWQSLIQLVREREKATKITWQYVPGHAGVTGNERCDIIATGYYNKKPADLYRGKLSQYTLPNILDISIDEKLLEKKNEKKSSSKSSGAPYAYVSFVDGVFMQHTTWAECEARVKGVKARFQKVFSVDELEQVKTEWGV
jgi:ribonuclease HI